jgi:hypothetical protein
MLHIYSRSYSQKLTIIVFVYVKLYSDLGTSVLLIFYRVQIRNSCLVKHLSKLLDQSCRPSMCLITLMSCRTNLRNFEALVLSYEVLLTAARTYVVMYVGSIRVMHTIVPWYPWLPHCLTIYPFCVDRVYPCMLTSSGSHFCRYV